jgi:ABC-type branched-subunit amino acid transport system permease subunit
MRFLAQKRGVQLADYRMIFYALTLILVMILRPQGIFGLSEVWDWRPWKWFRGWKKPEAVQT